MKLLSVPNLNPDIVLEHQIVPGPLYQNYEVCKPENYVCSFQFLDRSAEPSNYDLYTCTDDGTGDQTVLIRHCDSYASAYVNLRLEVAVTAQCRSSFWRKVVSLLVLLGTLSWQKTM